MKQNLLIKHNFISRKGSATVMALIFLLFFVVAGAGWAAMMAKEEGTATGDTNAQQAWYAAEAGMKRAQVELLSKNTGDGWEWLAGSADVPSDKFVNLETGKSPVDNAKPMYGVAISYPDSAAKKTVYLSTTQPMVTTTNTTTVYTITSIGKYKDSMRKIIKTFSVKAT